MKKIVVFASLLAAPVTQALAPNLDKADSREIRIKQFFEKNRCPVSKLAHEFVREADANELDWRLLPSITFVESSGGKHYQNNNIFGWNSNHTRFKSVRSGLHVVASALGNSTLYRDKKLDQILRTYNPRPEYALRVKSVMRRLSAQPITAMN